MTVPELKNRLAARPVIAAVREDGMQKALASPAAAVFCLRANLLTVGEWCRAAKKADKALFVHLDLADGVGRDRTGIAYLARQGVDGVISTRSQLIKAAHDEGLITVQRFFALDSQGVEAMAETLAQTSPDFVEIMPGVACKIIGRFAGGRTPVIAGGLIETPEEARAALDAGAVAVSTGCRALWDI